MFNFLREIANRNYFQSFETGRVMLLRSDFAILMQTFDAFLKLDPLWYQLLNVSE